MRTRPAKRPPSARDRKKRAAAKAVPTKKNGMVAADTKPVPDSSVSRVPFKQIRDAAWQVPEPEAAFPYGVDLELLRDVLSGNENDEEAEQREQILSLLCRPIGQRGRMQKHWNGDPDDIEATRTLFGPVLAGEIMTAISYPKKHSSNRSGIRLLRRRSTT